MSESMKGLKRSHRCAEVLNAEIGSVVTVMGWVQRSRNKGGIIFTDLRDRTGILQIAFEEAECGSEVFAKAATLRSEDCIAVVGTLKKREGAPNKQLATGELEVRADQLRILSGQVDGDADPHRRDHQPPRSAFRAKKNILISALAFFLLMICEKVLPPDRAAPSLPRGGKSIQPFQTGMHSGELLPFQRKKKPASQLVSDAALRRAAGQQQKHRRCRAQLDSVLLFHR